MSAYGERPPTGEDNSAQQLIPLSEEAVMRGLLHSIGSGNKSWEKTLRRFSEKTEIKEALESKMLARLISLSVGDDAWARRYAETSPLTYMSGAAIYYSCAVQESRIRGVPVPSIQPEDRAYWISDDIPNYEFIVHALEQEKFDDPEPLLDYIRVIGKRFEVFETETEPDFCRVLDREISYPEEVLTDMKLGAMDVHYLFRAHYERKELEEHLSP